MAPRWEVRPLEEWDRPVTRDRVSSARFRADWRSTLDLLGRQVELLGGDLIVLQVGVESGEIRRDGMLRANARVGFPGVKISFGSQYGPLTYATDVYEQCHHLDPPSWQANTRAIALALQALRAVDRYGVTSSGEQYRGWTAIAARSGEFAMDRQQAALLLSADVAYTPGQIWADPKIAQTAYQAAAAKHHPDRGGDPELFRRLTAARDLLVPKGQR